MILCLSLPVFAAEVSVIYKGRADGIVFEPKATDSHPDLFPEFKDVMPGDTFLQEITIKNESNLKSAVYLRALSVDRDPLSIEFLSFLSLTVDIDKKTGDETVFESAAHEIEGLKDWRRLGVIHSDGEITLNVMLEVSPELDNRFQNVSGAVEWEFMFEERPSAVIIPSGGGTVTPSDPDDPDEPDKPGEAHCPGCTDPTHEHTEEEHCPGCTCEKPSKPHCPGCDDPTHEHTEEEHCPGCTCEKPDDPTLPDIIHCPGCPDGDHDATDGSHCPDCPGGDDCSGIPGSTDTPDESHCPGCDDPTHEHTEEEHCPGCTCEKPDDPTLPDIIHCPGCPGGEHDTTDGSHCPDCPGGDDCSGIPGGTDEPEEPITPPTGDLPILPVLYAIAALSLIAIVLISILLIKKSKKTKQ